MRLRARSLALMVLAAVAGAAAAATDARAAPPARRAAAPPGGGVAASKGAIVERVEWEASDAGGRIVVVVRGEAGYSTHAASADAGAGLPARAYVDLRPATLGPKLARGPIPVGDGILQRIRIGQFDRQTVRVVVDLAEPAVFDVRAIDRPARLLLTLRPRAGAAVAATGQIAAPGAAAASAAAPSALAPAVAPSPPAATATGPEGIADAAPPAPLHPPGGVRPVEPQAPATIAEPVAAPAPAATIAPGLAAAPPEPSAAPEGGIAPRAAPAVEVARAKAGPEAAAPSSAVPPPARPAERGDGAGHGPGEGEAVRGAAEASHGASASAASPTAPADTPPGDAAVAVAPAPGAGPAANGVPGGRGRGAARAAPRARVVVLDPGHGGKDPGARGITGDEEKTITLAIAELVAERLKPDHDLRVVLTRTDDRTVSLEQRTAVANAQSADLFVSIHANASENVALAGIETYTLNNTNDRATIRLAAMENGLTLAGASRSEPDLAYILSDLLQTGKEDESVALAESIHGETVRTLRSRWKGVSSLGVKKGPFYVLVGAYMPCVLVEVGFLSHETEGQRVASRRYQRDVAEGIARGIRRFLDSGSAHANL